MKKKPTWRFSDPVGVELSDVLRKVLDAHNITPTDFRDRFGLSTATHTNIMTGKHVPSADVTQLLIENVTGQPLYWVLWEYTPK